MVSGQASCSALVHVSSTAAHLKGPRKHKWLHVQFPVSLFIRPCVVFHSVAFRQGVYAPFPSNASWLGPAVIKSSWTLLVGAGLGAVEYEICVLVCAGSGVGSGEEKTERTPYSRCLHKPQRHRTASCWLPERSEEHRSHGEWMFSALRITTGTLIIHRGGGHWTKAFWAEEILPFVAVFIAHCPVLEIIYPNANCYDSIISIIWSLYDADKSNL